MPTKPIDLSAGLQPTEWDAQGNPVPPVTRQWDEHGHPIVNDWQTVSSDPGDWKTVTPPSNPFDSLASGAPTTPAAGAPNPFDSVVANASSGQDQGGFLSHLWDNVNPGKIISSIGQLLQHPVQTYLADESARSADLKNAGQRAKQIVQSGASPLAKAGGLADTYAQGVADFVPFLGTGVNHAADEINQGNTGAGLGDAVGTGLAISAPDVLKAVPSFAKAATEVPGAVAAVPDAVGNAVSTVKNAVTVSPELKAAASATAPTVSDVQSAALPNLTSRIGKVLDDAAAQVTDAQGNAVDTTGITGLSDKAAVAGDAYKQAGQRAYSQLDDLAQQVTGKPWAFQKLASDVNTLQGIVDDPATSPGDLQGYQQQLTDAQGRLDQFTKAATDAGIPNVKAAIAQGNKLYSTGLSLEEVGRGIYKNERIVVGSDGSITRVLKNNNLPLNSAVGQVTADAAPRGHVLAQAVGKSGATEVQRAVADAGQQITQGKQAASATRQAARAAQEQVATVRGRQAAIVKRAGTAVIGAGAYGALRALYGPTDKQ